MFSPLRKSSPRNQFCSIYCLNYVLRTYFKFSNFTKLTYNFPEVWNVNYRCSPYCFMLEAFRTLETFLVTLKWSIFLNENGEKTKKYAEPAWASECWLVEVRLGSVFHKSNDSSVRQMISLVEFPSVILKRCYSFFNMQNRNCESVVLNFTRSNSILLYRQTTSCRNRFTITLAYVR